MRDSLVAAKIQLLTLFLALCAGVVTVFGYGVLSDSVNADDDNHAVKIVEAASESQLDALSDGIVTPSEHAAAVMRFAKCAEAAGMTVNVIPGRGLRAGRVGLTYVDSDGVADEASARTAHALAAQCKLVHLDAVDIKWAEQRPVLSAHDAAAQEARLLECVSRGGDPNMRTDGGWVFDGSRTLRIAPEDLLSYVQCARAEEEVTGSLAPRPR